MKRIISIVLALSFFVLITASCFAANDEDEWKNNLGTIDLSQMTVTGKGITVNDNTVLITQGGDFTVTGEKQNGMIRVNTDDKVKLRLSGMTLTNTGGPAIYFENAEKAFITITEDTQNYLSDNGEYTIDDADAVIFSNDDLEIKGDGSLTINGNYKHGIASDDDLTIENGVITINSNEHGLKVNDDLTVTGGTLNITSETGKGMKAGKSLTIDAGDINIVSEQSEGIESKGTLTINGGDISINAKDDGINTGEDSTETGEKANMGRPDMGNLNMGRGSMESSSAESPNTENFDTGKNNMARPDMGNPDMRNSGMERGNMTRPDMESPDMNNREIPDMREGNGKTGSEFNSDIENNAEGNSEAERQNTQMQFGKNRENPAEISNDNADFRPDMGNAGAGGGFGRIDEETAAAHAITINGGNIYLKVGGDGIDSNGSLTITGGTITIDGPENNGNGPLDSEGTFTISGGEVLTLSSAGMMQLPTESSGVNILKVVFDGQGTNGDSIVLKDSNGNVIAEHTAATNYKAFVYISDALKTGSEYSVYQNDELKYNAQISEGTTSAGNSEQQMMGGAHQKRNTGNISSQGISVTVDGQNISFDTNPVIKNGTTLVGFRSILEKLGAEVGWDAETQTVTAKKDGISVVLKINSNIADVNGESIEMSASPEIIGNTTMIPVRFISEQLGMDVEWNNETKNVSITSK